MRKKTFILIPAALVLAGTVSIPFAHANTTPHQPRTAISAVAPDPTEAGIGADVQSGDQSAPDGAATPETGADVQSGDQSAPDGAATPETGAGAEATGPDTDKLEVQNGDQTGPDTGAAEPLDTGR